jgi:hypothetical protein
LCGYKCSRKTTQDVIREVEEEKGGQDEKGGVKVVKGGGEETFCFSAVYLVSLFNI